MDPNSDRLTGLNLPQPMESAPPAAAVSGESLPRGPELVPMTGEHITSGPVAPSVIQASNPLQGAVQQYQTPVAPQASGRSVAAPAVADDTDLIEKEWVNKAKQIVEETREDPYTQSEELTKFKAEYMQKRYNKTLKLSE